jgi:nuclear transcription factor Y alpha
LVTSFLSLLEGISSLFVGKSFWKIDMAMQPVYLKKHEGIVHNSVGQYSSVNSSAPWWTNNNASGSQSVYGGESCGQMKPFSLELSNYINQLAPTKHLPRGIEQLFDKGHSTNQFTIFLGTC